MLNIIYNSNYNYIKSSYLNIPELYLKIYHFNHNKRLKKRWLSGFHWYFFVPYVTVLRFAWKKPDSIIYENIRSTVLDQMIRDKQILTRCYFLSQNFCEFNLSNEYISLFICWSCWISLHSRIWSLQWKVCQVQQCLLWQLWWQHFHLQAVQIWLWCLQWKVRQMQRRPLLYLQ